MISTLPTSLQNKINAMNRLITSADYPGGFAGLIGDMVSQLSAGGLGIDSDSADVDSVAVARAFSQNADTTAGLTLGYYGGKLTTLGGVVNVAAGTLVLSGSTTNYVECTPAGVVQKT